MISDEDVFDTFAEARDAREGREHLQICGVQTGPEEGKYFLVDRDADDAVVRDISFAIREGRDLGPGERRMIDLVDTHVSPGFLEVNTDGRSVAGDGSAGPSDPPAAGEDPDPTVGMEGPVA